MKYTTTINKSQSKYRRTYAEKRNAFIGFFIGIILTILVCSYSTNAHANTKSSELVSLITIGSNLGSSCNIDIQVYGRSGITKENCKLFTKIVNKLSILAKELGEKKVTLILIDASANDLLFQMSLQGYLKDLEVFNQYINLYN